MTCKFGPFLARQKPRKGNMSHWKSTLTLGGALYGEAKLQPFPMNSVDKAVLRLRTLPLDITWSEDENKMPSNRFWRQSEPSEVNSYNELIHIHLYNSLSTLLKPQSFSTIFTQNENTLLLCARETVTENCALCWTVFILLLDVQIAVIEYGFNDNLKMKQ